MHPTTSLGALVADSIEVLMQGGRRITFSGLVYRDAVYRQLHTVRLHARTEWASGLSRWRPWRLRLVPPLVLHNLLPCELRISLRQLTAPEWDLIRKTGVAAPLTGEGTGEVLYILDQNATLRKAIAS